jgi:hypothetical protein
MFTVSRRLIPMLYSVCWHISEMLALRDRPRLPALNGTGARNDVICRHSGAWKCMTSRMVSVVILSSQYRWPMYLSSFLKIPEDNPRQKCFEEVVFDASKARCVCPLNWKGDTSIPAYPMTRRPPRGDVAFSQKKKESVSENVQNLPRAFIQTIMMSRSNHVCADLSIFP